MITWTPHEHRGTYTCGPYEIHRNIQDYAVWRYDGNPKCLGRCQTLLEAQLLASVDMALDEHAKV